MCGPSSEGGRAGHLTARLVAEISELICFQHLAGLPAGAWESGLPTRVRPAATCGGVQQLAWCAAIKSGTGLLVVSRC